MDYRKRMTEYYPQVLRDFRDIQGIIFTEYYEFALLNENSTDVLDEAFLDTMSAERISEWEKLLKISVPSGATLEDRRSVIIGKLTDPGDMNESVIQEIVASMTNGTAEVSFSDGTLYVGITADPVDGRDLYAEVDKELSQRIPAHIRLEVGRTALTWNVVKTQNSTWGSVKNNYQSWRYVKTEYPNVGG